MKSHSSCKGVMGFFYLYFRLSLYELWVMFIPLLFVSKENIAYICSVILSI